MKVTAVCCGRNDNYGGHLIESGFYSINSMLKTFDEVIYVDWNTDENKKVLTDEIDLENREKLKVIEVRPQLVKKLFGDKKMQPMCEVMARNIGIRRATGDIIVSTNTDIIVPTRRYLDLLIEDLKENTMFTLARQNIELEHIEKQFGKNYDINEMLPNIFGIFPINNYITSPFLIMDKNIISKHPDDTHPSLSSLIRGCGDFQMAYKSTWHKIKGFEETLKKRFYTDTHVQYKVIMSGGIVKTTNFPPVYHINHDRDDTHEHNDISMDPFTSNDENWGLKDTLQM
jgi:hypothetical protein